jgi:hypothetical protein
MKCIYQNGSIIGKGGGKNGGGKGLSINEQTTFSLEIFLLRYYSATNNEKYSQRDESGNLLSQDIPEEKSVLQLLRTITSCQDEDYHTHQG